MPHFHHISKIEGESMRKKVTKMEESGNKGTTTPLNYDMIDDNFDFIRFLNDVRLKYNLSPTPLIEEHEDH